MQSDFEIKFIENSQKIKIAHIVQGDPSNQPVCLLIMGHGGTQTAWPNEFIQPFRDQGFCVIRFDNRDMGSGHKFDDVLPDPRPLTAPGANPENKHAYLMSDIADDAICVLNHYKIDKAHIIGLSMGGLITQIIAVNYPQRCRSFTPIMTAADLNKAVMQGGFAKNPEWMTKMFSWAMISPTKDWTKEQVVDQKFNIYAHLNKTDIHPEELSEQSAKILKDHLATEYDRGYVDWEGKGGARQSLGMTEWSRLHLESHIEGLKKSNLPCLVLHGKGDQLVPLEYGQELAGYVPGSQMVEYDGGHNFGHMDHPEVLKNIVDSALNFVKKVDGK